jgi:hypothetical protein
VVEPISPWSRNPGSDDPDDPDDVDVVTDRLRAHHGPPATLPADRIRHGARHVRWCALLLALISIAGSALTTYGLDDESFSPYGRGWAQFGQFLSGTSWSIGVAGLVLAAAYALGALAARIDLDHAVAERATRDTPR